MSIPFFFTAARTVLDEPMSIPGESEGRILPIAAPDSICKLLLSKIIRTANADLKIENSFSNFPE
jgi:hypothetical protein